jgi:cyanophycinase-like exopeptidase
MSASIFLHGGGGTDPSANQICFSPFVETAYRTSGIPKLILVLHQRHEADLEAYQKMLIHAGAKAEHITTVMVSEDRSLTGMDIVGASGVFVAGGHTPDIHYALCQDISWLRTLNREHIPYCGTSAGATITAQNAIVGGYKIKRKGRSVQMMHPAASEGIEMLDVRAGLNIIPQVFQAVDVHASQGGTLLRALHMVEQGHCHTIAAIDEDTTVEFAAGQVIIYGLGQMYEVRRIEYQVEISIFNQ